MLVGSEENEEHDTCWLLANKTTHIQCLTLVPHCVIYWFKGPLNTVQTTNFT